MNIICIDPGHGGRDPGAVGAGGLREKDVVFAIAQKMEEIVNENLEKWVALEDDITRVQSRANNPATIAFFETRGGIENYVSNQRRRQQELKYTGFKLILTRSGDTFINGVNRVKISRGLSATHFISLHCNAATNRLATGIETFSRGGNRSGEWLGNHIRHKILNATRWRDRGAKTANFTVLGGYNHTIPSCLVEFNFISNLEMEAVLKLPETQNRLAVAVLDGIEKYSEIWGNMG